MNDIEIEKQSAKEFVEEVCELISEYSGNRLELSVEVKVRLMTYLTQKHEEEKAAMVREILHGIGDYESKNQDKGWLKAVTENHIKAIAAKHVDLSKTDVTE